MNNKFKEIGIKNRTYYFFDDLVNIKNLDPNKIKIDGKSYKNILSFFVLNLFCAGSNPAHGVSEIRDG